VLKIIKGQNRLVPFVKIFQNCGYLTVVDSLFYLGQGAFAFVFKLTIVKVVLDVGGKYSTLSFWPCQERMKEVCQNLLKRNICIDSVAFTYR